MSSTPATRHPSLLAILQQSEYDLHDFQRWYRQHASEDLDLKPDQWTAKLKLIGAVTRLLSFMPELKRYVLATQLVTPLDLLIRQAYYLAAQLKLMVLRARGLQVVAIAGSYAKTSTKTIMAHLLSGEQNILITPKSINTTLGIAQVILSQLRANHQLFIVEFGEYNSQDIEQLTSFIKPDYGILTPIGRQHLERFGDIAAIAQTFQPLVSFFNPFPLRLLISEQNAHFFETGTQFIQYGLEDKTPLRVFEPQLSRQGTEFTVQTPKTSFKVFMPLYGEHQATNTLPSFWLAEKLQLDPQSVVKRAATLPYLDRRHQPHFAENNVLILDNSYNTNPDAVTASLKLLNQLNASRRIIITAGFVELGEATHSIHRQFGTQLAASVDYVGLVETPWLDDIIEGFIAAGGKREHIVVGKDFDQALAKLSGMIIANSVVLFEGGFREVYI